MPDSPAAHRGAAPEKAVWVLAPDRKTRRVPVATGETDGTYTELVKGEFARRRPGNRGHSSLPVRCGKRRTQVQEGRVPYDAAVADYRQIVLTAFEQVEDALAQLRILTHEAGTTDAAVKAAQQSLDISTIQYRGGLANYLQVIAAQANTLQAQRAAVEIRTRRLVTSIALIQASGGGWERSQLPRI